MSGTRGTSPRPRPGRIQWAAADLTAETFAQAWLHRRRFRDRREGSALPWLLGIARNVLRESARRDRIATRARERLGLPLGLAAEAGYDEVEDRLSPRRALARALEDLPEHERDALQLRVVDELGYEEVADRLDIRPAAARRRRPSPWPGSSPPSTRSRSPAVVRPSSSGPRRRWRSRPVSPFTSA